MTRHVIDHREAPDSRKRVARILKKDKQELGQTRRRKLIEHPHETGNGRLVQFMKIERGREA
ncbi:MAG: hypothetical protein ABF254_03240 [Octadecabacter sp.]